MKQNLLFGTHRRSLALAMALAAGSAGAQTIHVGGDGVIGDTVLATTAGTALVGVTGGSWKANGGLGGPVSSTLVSPGASAVVPSSGNVTLTFTHRYDFENGWDGGAVFISVNDAPAVYLTGAAFSANGYVGNTTATIGGPSLAWAGGENVFYGQSAGYSTPALITSVASLGTLNAGAKVSVQFKGEWDGATTNGPPAWEIGSVKLTDTLATDFYNVNFATQGSSSYTVSNVGAPTGPWAFSVLAAPSSFEINGDTLAADRYAPDVPGSVLNLSNAAIVVELLAGTLEAGEVFTLFDLSGGTTLTGTPLSITLPPLGIWNTSNLATNGTITFVSPPPNLTWNLTGPGNGVWDTVTANWTENGVDPTTFVPAANATFDKADGGNITVTQGMSPTATTVNSAGTYKFITGTVVSGPAQSNSIITGTLVKNGAGTLRLGDDLLTATNLYSNGFSSVTVNAGSLVNCSPEAFGSGTITLAGGVTWVQACHEGRLGFAGESIPNAVVLSGGAVNDGLVNTPSAFSNENKGISLTGNVSGPGGFSVTGAAGSQRSLGLSGNNTFAGGVKLTVASGNTTTAGVEIGSYTALGTGTFTVSEPSAMNPTTPRGGFRSVANLPGSVEYPNGVTNPIVIVDGKFFNVYVATSTHTLQLGGTISGNGTLNKWKAGTVVLSGSNTYTGGTRVDNGTLTINGSLADATMSVLGGTAFAGTVNGTGSLTVNINGTNSDQITITGGTFNGSLVATGLNLVINPTGAGLTQPEYVLVTATGGGTITGPFASITGVPPAYTPDYSNPAQVKLVRTLTPFETWSGGPAAEIDTNGDGVTNGVAWALGAANPAANAIGLLPALDNTSDPAYLIFDFNRSDAANADPLTAITVEYGNTLAGWTTAVDDNDNVEIEVTPGSPTDAIRVKLKRSTVGASGKLFVRLKTVVSTP